MMKKHTGYMTLIFIIILSSFTVHGDEFVGIADLYITGDISGVDGYTKDLDLSRHFFRELPDQERKRLYTYVSCAIMGSGEFADWIARNESEAGMICSLVGVKYLVYGTLKPEGSYLDAALHVYDRDKKKNIRTITHISRNAPITGFLTELGLKLNTVMNNDVFNRVVIEQKKDVEREVKNELMRASIRKFRLHHYLGIYNSVGYPVPVMNTWWSIMTGVIDVETGIKVVNLPALYAGERFGVGLRPGLTFTYALSVNKPQLKSAYMHTILFNMPLDVCFRLYDRFVITTGLGVQGRLDVYQQQFDSGYSSFVNGAFSLFTGAGFEVWPGKDRLFCVGLNNTVDVAFYEDVYIDYKVQMYTMVRFRKPD